MTVTGAVIAIVTVKVNDLATIRSDDPSGDLSLESWPDSKSLESPPEAKHPILNRCSSCSSQLKHFNYFN